MMMVMMMIIIISCMPGLVPDTWIRLSRNMKILGTKFNDCHAFCTACGA